MSGTESVDLACANRELAELTPTERIEWSTATFDIGLFALTSAGVESALLCEQVSQSGQDLPFLHINTGFLHQETLEFRKQLQQRYGFILHEVGPSPKEVKIVEDSKLWDQNFREYSRITKLTPLSNAINWLGITALISGIRADQTKNRSTKSFIEPGSDGELRLNLMLDVSDQEAERLFKIHDLPRHPLYYQGYDSVADRYTTKPGRGRSGRQHEECGLHLVDGCLIRAS